MGSVWLLFCQQYVEKVVSDIAHLDFKRTYNRVFEIKMFLSPPLLRPQIWAALDVRGKFCERNGCWKVEREMLVRT